MTRAEALDAAERALAGTPVTRACLVACTEGDLRVIAQGIGHFLSEEQAHAARTALTILMLTPPLPTAERAGRARGHCRFCRSEMHQGNRCPERGAREGRS